MLHYEEFGAERVISLAGHARLPRINHTRSGSRGAVRERRLRRGDEPHPRGPVPRQLRRRTARRGLRATERYTLSDDGDWLFLVLELVDPATLSEPLILTKSWRRSPNAAILQYRCDVMAGQLEGAFADYIDPRDTRCAAAQRTSSNPCRALGSDLRPDPSQQQREEEVRARRRSRPADRSHAAPAARRREQREHEQRRQRADEHRVQRAPLLLGSSAACSKNSA